MEEKFKFMKPGEVRTRFAPAPTGFLHIGSGRTSLFNYLFAKKHQGVFVLRIEDTDIERSKKEFEEDIINNLKWLGIEWDEGPDIGGDYGPYRQSERLNIYAKYLEKLLEEGKAYYCFCPEQELEAQKQYRLSIGEAPRYSGKCSQLSQKEIKKHLKQGKSSVIRFRVLPKKIKFIDLIRGDIEFDSSFFGDIVISKNLLTPLYNFACVVDDFEMKISHILRGEEHISNTPKQILIQEALDFPQIKYAHFPLILAPDRSKLSKRYGAVSIADYKKTGYLPEALINFMVFLGWNPGDEREIFSLRLLTKEFFLEGVQKGGAVFNIQKLDFLNGFYIRQRSVEKLTELCLPYLIKSGLIEQIENNPGNPEDLKIFKEEKPKYKIKKTGQEISQEKLEKIISLYQKRLKKLSEIIDLTDFFFNDKLEVDESKDSSPPFANARVYDKNLLRWREMADNEIKTALDKLEKILSKIETDDWSKENLEKTLMPEADKFSKEIAKKAGLPAEALAKAGDRGYLLWPLRVALTGKEASAGPFEIAEILGKEKTLKRIIKAKEKL